MFFNKGKKSTTKTETTAEVVQETTAEVAIEAEPVTEQPVEDATQPAQSGSSYAFYKPDPYPKELVSVISKMLQRLFPDTKRAYLLEAQKSDKKGYLLIVDIDSKFLKIINIYLDGETKRVRGDIPIECVLYSKSGSLTEGIDPFYSKESAESKANNLASKEFSGEVVFSQMPEFELFSKSQNPDSGSEISFDSQNAEPDAKADHKELSKDRKPVIIPVEPRPDHKEKTNAKVKPADKKELFGILNEFGSKKTGTVSAVAIAAIKEYEFYIPYTLGKEEASDTVDTSLTIDEKLRFKKLVNPEDETQAVPLFTQKEDALSFAQRGNCKIVCLKYKDFAASRAAELTGFDGVVINPDDECIFLLSTHPLLG